MSNPVAVIESNGAHALVQEDSRSKSITDLLHLAVSRGTPTADLKELVDLHERMEARQAQRDFSAAMAAFQNECPSIKHNKTAKIATSVGAGFAYSYAELDEIARTINPLMSKHGLSYGWDTTVDAKDMLTCVCTVRHANGHSEKSTFTLPVNNPSAMSPQQKMGAALTFAQRRSLSAVLGLTTTDEDNDSAAGAGGPPISDDQLTTLQDFLTELGGRTKEKLLAHFGIDALGKLPASEYDNAIKVLHDTKRLRAERRKNDPA